MEHPAAALYAQSILNLRRQTTAHCWRAQQNVIALLRGRSDLWGHESNTSAVDAKYFEHDLGWPLFCCIALPHRPMATAQNKRCRQHCRPWYTNVVADNLGPKDGSAACNAPYVFIGRARPNAPVRYRLKRRSARNASVGFKPDGRSKGPCYARRGDTELPGKRAIRRPAQRNLATLHQV